MRKLTKISTGMLAGVAALSLAACGGAEDATTDDDTTVTDVDPGEGDGTIGAEGEMGMEDGMPADAPMPDGDAPAEEDGDGEAEGQ